MYRQIDTPFRRRRGAQHRSRRTGRWPWRWPGMRRDQALRDDSAIEYTSMRLDNRDEAQLGVYSTVAVSTCISGLYVHLLIGRGDLSCTAEIYIAQEACFTLSPVRDMQNRKSIGNTRQYDSAWEGPRFQPGLACQASHANNRCHAGRFQLCRRTSKPKSTPKDHCDI